MTKNMTFNKLKPFLKKMENKTIYHQFFYGFKLKEIKNILCNLLFLKVSLNSFCNLYNLKLRISFKK